MSPHPIPVLTPATLPLSKNMKQAIILLSRASAVTSWKHADWRLSSHSYEPVTENSGDLRTDMGTVIWGVTHRALYRRGLTELGQLTEHGRAIAAALILRDL